eukprot:640966-Prymnesium_polylepis.1
MDGCAGDPTFGCPPPYARSSASRASGGATHLGIGEIGSRGVAVARVAGRPERRGSRTSQEPGSRKQHEHRSSVKLHGARYNDDTQTYTRRRRAREQDNTQTRSRPQSKPGTGEAPVGRRTLQRRRRLNMAAWQWCRHVCRRSPLGVDTKEKRSTCTTNTHSRTRHRAMHHRLRTARRQRAHERVGGEVAIVHQLGHELNQATELGRHGAAQRVR